MNIYYTTYPGIHIGGLAIIAARNIKEARELLHEGMARSGIEQDYKDACKEMKKFPISKTGILYFDNGDY